MESLYACLFSNGHIKVARSVDPKSRIAAHADRVACMGVELSDHFIAECNGPAIPREASLIARCTDAADRRFQNEWFEGLDFLSVTEWTAEAAQTMFDPTSRTDSFGSRLRAARIAAALTQTDLGRGLGFHGDDMTKATVCGWEMDRCSPNVKQLRALCERLSVSADHLLNLSVNA